MKMILRSAFILVLSLSLMIGMVACGTPDSSENELPSETSTESSEADDTGDKDTETDTTTNNGNENGNNDNENDNNDNDKNEENNNAVNPYENSLDGKKIIFIGNSYTYYGQTVLEKSPSKYLTQASRKGDKGYFYQLCKANGMNVEVTNWTFGGHGLRTLFCGSCYADRGCDGKDHKAYLTDAAYDYVVIQPGSGETSDKCFVEDMQTVMSFFKAANPNVKFALLVPYNDYGEVIDAPYLHKNILNSLKDLANEGVTIVDWGGIVVDILNGSASVPGGTQEYEKNTFVVRKSTTDGYHPNQLSGYITTLMTYCALTGASAVGQPYDFCNNSLLRPAGGSNKFFSFSSFISTYYKNGATTNYPKVFDSKSDMEGIQTLVDRQIAAKKYMDFNFATDGGATSPSEDAEAVAAGNVAKVLNNGVTTYLTKDELQTKIKAYANGDYITLLTDVTCEGPTSSSNMKSVKVMSVTFDLNAKNLTLTKGSIMRSSSSDGYKPTFRLISSNGKGTLTLAEGNTYTAFQLYGSDKNITIGSEEGYADGDCVEINCARLLYASTYNSNDASTTSFTVYGGAINQTSVDGDGSALITLYERNRGEQYTTSYYMGSIKFVGTTISQKVQTQAPLFRIGRYSATDTPPASYKNAPGITLTDCIVSGYSDTTWLHDMETLNAKITYNNCTVKGDITKVGVDTSDEGLGKVVLGAGTTFSTGDTSAIRPYNESALTTYEASASGVYLDKAVTLKQNGEEDKYTVTVEA